MLVDVLALPKLLTLLETTDSPSFPPENYVIPTSPLKKTFPPAPQAMKMTLCLVSLLTQKLSPKRQNFLNDLPPPNPTPTYNLVISCLNDLDSFLMRSGANLSAADV